MTTYPARPHRYQTHIPIQVARPDGPQVAYIVDINERGACVAGLTDVETGEAVILHGMDNERIATVRWTASNRAGVQFNRPVPAKHINLMRYRSPSMQPFRETAATPLH